VIRPSTTLAEIASHRPGPMRELERFGLDHCGGGRRSLAEACRERALDPGAIAAELNSVPVAEAAPRISSRGRDPIPLLSGTRQAMRAPTDSRSDQPEMSGR